MKEFETTRYGGALASTASRRRERLGIPVRQPVSRVRENEDCTPRPIRIFRSLNSPPRALFMVVDSVVRHLSTKGRLAKTAVAFEDVSIGTRGASPTRISAVPMESVLRSLAFPVVRISWMECGAVGVDYVMRGFSTARLVLLHAMQMAEMF